MDNAAQSIGGEWGCSAVRLDSSDRPRRVGRTGMRGKGNQVKRENIAMGIAIAGPDRGSDSRIRGRCSKGGTSRAMGACKANPGEQVSWDQPGQGGDGGDRCHWCDWP